jgi:hypothetical protein
MRRILLTSIAALVGCASAKTTPAGPVATETVRLIGVNEMTKVSMTPTVALRADTVATSVEQVWDVLPVVYESLGIPVTQLDATKHVVGNPGFKLRRQLGGVSLTRYLDCGRGQGGPSAETYEVHLTVLSEVQPAAPAVGTTVATLVEAMAKPVTFSGEYVRCSSSGTLEARILNGLKARLAGG